MTSTELCQVIVTPRTQGRILGGLWGPGPPGVTKGAPKRRKGKEKRGEKRGKKGNKKENRVGRKLNQYEERGAMQFQVQTGAPGKKTSGAPN